MRRWAALAAAVLTGARPAARNWQEASGELLPASDFPTLAEPMPG